MALSKVEMWTKTADGVDAAVEQINTGEMTANQQGRAFLTSCSRAMRAVAGQTPADTETR